MRQIVLDVETTGLETSAGHRIIEIGCIELANRRPTGQRFHRYLNPEREIDAGALAVHGIEMARLLQAPKFAEIAAELVGFIEGAELIIHNAPFDVGFLDAELSRIELSACREIAHAIVDTLQLAREAFPGKRNNLDALCERFAVDNGERTLHGALLDAKLLSEVYLALTRGQESLAMDLPKSAVASASSAHGGEAGPRPAVLVIVPTEAELAAHRAYLEALDAASRGRCVWLALEREIGRAA